MEARPTARWVHGRGVTGGVSTGGRSGGGAVGVGSPGTVSESQGALGAVMGEQGGLDVGMEVDPALGQEGYGGLNAVTGEQGGFYAAVEGVSAAGEEHVQCMRLDKLICEYSQGCKKLIKAFVSRRLVGEILRLECGKILWAMCGHLLSHVRQSWRRLLKGLGEAFVVKLSGGEHYNVWRGAKALRWYFRGRSYPKRLPKEYLQEKLSLVARYRECLPQLLEMFCQLEELHSSTMYKILEQIRGIQMEKDGELRKEQLLGSSVNNFTDVEIPSEIQALLGFGPKHSFGFTECDRKRLVVTLVNFVSRVLIKHLYQDAPPPGRRLKMSLKDYVPYFHHPKLPAYVRDFLYSLLMYHGEFLLEEVDLSVSVETMFGAGKGFYTAGGRAYWSECMGMERERPRLGDLYGVAEDGGFLNFQGEVEALDASMGELEVLKGRLGLVQLSKFLKKHPGNVLISSDKGCGYCYLRYSYFKAQYDIMIRKNPLYVRTTLLRVEGSYHGFKEELDAIMDLYRDKLISEGEWMTRYHEMKMRMLQVGKVLTPSVNLIPKVHKLKELPSVGMGVEAREVLLRKMPCRPIVTGHSSICAVVERYLADVFKIFKGKLVEEIARRGLVGVIPKSTSVVLEKVSEVEKVAACGESIGFLKYDFSSLYTNLRQKDLVAVLEKVVVRYGYSKEFEEFLVRLVGLSFSHNFVDVAGELYKAEDGCPMGSYVSREVADLILLWAELQMVDLLVENGLREYFRWIDDGFGIMSFSSYGSVSRVIKALRDMYPSSLEFEVEFSRFSVVILDYVLVNWYTPWRGFYYYLFMKATNRKMIPGPTSSHPMFMKVGGVKTESRRYLQHCCVEAEYVHFVKLLWWAYRKSGYKLQWFISSVYLFCEKLFLFPTGEHSTWAELDMAAKVSVGGIGAEGARQAAASGAAWAGELGSARCAEAGQLDGGLGAVESGHVVRLGGERQDWVGGGEQLDTAWLGRFGEKGRRMIYIPLVYTYGDVVDKTVKRCMKDLCRKEAVQAVFFYEVRNQVGKTVFVKKRFHDGLSEAFHWGN